MSELLYNHAVSQLPLFCFDAAPVCHSRRIITLCYSCRRFVLIQLHWSQLLYNYAVFTVADVAVLL